MVDELLGEVLVDGAEVTLGEQGVDELGNGVLVLLNSVHNRSLRRTESREYPNNLGSSAVPGAVGCASPPH